MVREVVVSERSGTQGNEWRTTARRASARIAVVTTLVFPAVAYAVPPTPAEIEREVMRLLGASVAVGDCRVRDSRGGATRIFCRTERCDPNGGSTVVTATLAFRQGRARVVTRRTWQRPDQGQCGCGE